MALPSTITEHELWALTLKVEREHGDGAPAYIAQQISEAAKVGQQVGVDLWEAIAIRYDRLDGRSMPPS